MTLLLFLGSILSFLVAMMALVGAQSSLHELIVGIFFVCAAIQFAGGAITYTINKLSKKLDSLADTANPKQPVPRLAPEPTIDSTPVPVIPQPTPERRDQPPPSARSWVDDAREQLQKEKGATS